MELKDKVVVITGGSKGFGRALAEAFVTEGANVVICAHHKNVETIAKEMGVLGIKADVRQENDMTTLLQFTLNKFGRIDIWINNAGVWLPHAYVEDFDMIKVKKMIDVNLIGVINGCRVALRYMKEKNAGTILNIVSDSALSGRPRSSAYGASKWGEYGFTKAIRAENKDKKILILSVLPGGMDTSIFGDNTKPYVSKTLMDPKDVARKVIENLKLNEPEEEMIIEKEDL